MDLLKVFYFTLLSTLPLWATSYTWNIDSNGNWSTDSNWNPSSGFPNSSGDTSTFGSVITSPRTITVDSAFSVDSISLSGSQAYLIAPQGGGDSLTLGGGISSQNIVVTGSAAHTISSPLSLAADIVISQGSTSPLTISGAISGAHAISQTGGHTLILSAANTYTGTNNRFEWKYLDSKRKRGYLIIEHAHSEWHHHIFWTYKRNSSKFARKFNRKDFSIDNPPSNNCPK
jgi:hypothetical protein